MKLLKPLTQIAQFPELRVRLWVVLCVILLCLPWGSFSLWHYLYAFTGDLTPATWVVFFIWIGFPKVFQTWACRELPFLRRLFLLSGMLVFYVLALGNWSFDPYSYGYQPWGLLLGLTLWVVWRGRQAPGIVVLLAIDMVVFSLHGLASDNLWDYLTDPVLMLVLGYSVIRSDRFKSIGQGQL